MKNLHSNKISATQKAESLLINSVWQRPMGTGRGATLYEYGATPYDIYGINKKLQV